MATLKVTLKDLQSKDDLDSVESEDEIVKFAIWFLKMFKEKNFDFKSLAKGDPQMATKV